VWLKPRRVFRELAAQPIGAKDYLLGAGQGVVGWLALSRAENWGEVSSLAVIFGKAIVVGSIAGIATLFLMAAIYSRLGTEAGKPKSRDRVIHVLAYGSVPVVASLVLWVFAALLAGEATFEQVPHGDVEAFVALLLHAQFFSYLLLQVWGIVIQIMGLSEIQGVTFAKALVLWVLGQIIGFLGMLFLMIVIVTLLPNAGGG